MANKHGISPQSEAAEPEHINMLMPRQNDYAMVCASDSAATKQCQSRGAYYCNGAGQLSRDTRRGFRIYTCEEMCICMSLAPKPNCILGLSGALYCSRGVDDGEWHREEQETGVQELDGHDVEG